MRADPLLLFGLTLSGRFRDDVSDIPSRRATDHGRITTGALGRCAVALLVAGLVLLNGADAAWAHAVGVVCLFGFMMAGFGAIAVPALDDDAASPPPRRV